MVQSPRNVVFFSFATLAATATLVSASTEFSASQHELRDITDAELGLRSAKLEDAVHARDATDVDVQARDQPAVDARDEQLYARAMEQLEARILALETREALYGREYPDDEIVARDLYEDLDERYFEDEDIESRDHEDSVEARDFEEEFEARALDEELPRDVIPPAVLPIVHRGIRKLWNRATSADSSLSTRNLDAGDLSHLSARDLVERGTEVIQTMASVIARDIEELETRDLSERSPVEGDSIQDHARRLWYSASQKRADVDAHVGSVGPKELEDVGRHLVRSLTVVVSRDIDNAQSLEARRHEIFSREFLDVDDLD